MKLTEISRKVLPPFSGALPIMILSVNFLSVLLAAAEEFDLPLAQTSAWIIAAYGLAGLLSIMLALHYRQPLQMTGNAFVLIFVASLAGEIAFAELTAAALVAGFIIIPLTLLGLMKRLGELMPAPIVFGLLAGAIMPFVTGIFPAFIETPWPVGATVVAYILGRRFIGHRIPPILPATVAGLVMTGLTSQFGSVTSELSLPIFVITRPEFSLNALLSTVPVIVVLIIFQANLPSLVYMRSEGYVPPERTLNLITGLATMIASLMGPVGISLSLPSTSLVAGPPSGEKSQRYIAVLWLSAEFVLIGLLAGVAVILLEVIPLPLLLALAGLAMIDVLANALKEVTRGPMTLGPLFTFVIVQSGASYLGLSAYFWAIVIGTTIAFVLERDAWNKPRRVKIEKSEHGAESAESKEA